MHADGCFRTRETIRVIAWRGTESCCRKAAIGERPRSAARPPLSGKKRGNHDARDADQPARSGGRDDPHALVTWAKIACGAALTAALLGIGPVHLSRHKTTTPSCLLPVARRSRSVPGTPMLSRPSPRRMRPLVMQRRSPPARAPLPTVKMGQLAEGSLALAVAHPDEGAATETWLTSTEAKNNKDNVSPVRKVVENKCHQEKEEKAPPVKEAPVPDEAAPAPAPEVVPVELPNTGVGLAGAAGLSSLFAAASAAAALGSMALRGRARPVFSRC